MTKKDFERLARTIRAIQNPTTRRAEAWRLMPGLKASNPRFSPVRFLVACDIAPAGWDVAETSVNDNG